MSSSFVPAPPGFRLSYAPHRLCLRRAQSLRPVWTKTHRRTGSAPRMCSGEGAASPPASASDQQQSTEVCTYCENKNIVECPACEGRGYFGRTITCYYCHGAKEIECPLCVDDVYRFSYVKDTESAAPAELDDDEEAVE